MRALFAELISGDVPFDAARLCESRKKSPTNKENVKCSAVTTVK